MAAVEPAKLITEFIGTFFLCLTVGLAAGNSDIAQIAIGMALMVCVYAGGHVSGGHYNPAVTCSLLVRKAIEPVPGVVYMVAQFVGSTAAYFTAVFLITKEKVGTPSITDSTIWEAGVAEFLGTFALCSVILHVATTKEQNNNSYYGLAIGFTVLSQAVAIGGISGCALNPAVGLLNIIKTGDMTFLAMMAFQIVGGAVAAAVFLVITKKDDERDANSGMAAIAPLIIEFIGTFFLCYTVATTCRSGGGAGVLTPLSIGSILMCMIYMGAYISGAHYNPAVTVGVLLRNIMDKTHDDFNAVKAVKYIVAQLVGAAAAVWTASFVVKSNTKTAVTPGYTQLQDGYSATQAVIAELVGTFLLVYVVLNVATVAQLHGNNFFGLAIGMVITVVAVGLGPVSAGAFNPAVGSMGLFYAGNTDFWVYWVGPIVGALLAGGIFKVQNPDEFDPAFSDKKYMAHVEAGEEDVRLHAHVHSHVKPEQPEGDKETGSDSE